MRFDHKWQTPEDTFHTWVDATIAADEQGLGQCYWHGMTRQELDAWLGINLRPESRALLQGATWLGIRPKSAVEVNFTIRTKDGRELRGVMVRTAKGWKIQSW